MFIVVNLKGELKVDHLVKLINQTGRFNKYI